MIMKYGSLLFIIKQSLHNIRQIDRTIIIILLQVLVTEFKVYPDSQMLQTLAVLQVLQYKTLQGTESENYHYYYY